MRVAVPFGAAAEVVCALGPGAASYKASADERPTSDAMEMARRMNAALSPICSPKCPQIAIFRNPTAANAMLVVTPDQAKFVYAPQFFQTVYDNYGDGAIIAIIAHEFGHALDEIYPGKFGRGGTPELRADAWAGCTVAQTEPEFNRPGGGSDRRFRNIRLPLIRVGRCVWWLCGSGTPNAAEMAQSSTAQPAEMRYGGLDRASACDRISSEQPGWPQLQEISGVSVASSQDVLQ